jgi:hypothetical protein
LIMQILSARYIYMTNNHNDPVWSQARNFLLKFAQDVDQPVHIRSEAADCLCLSIVANDCRVGENVINSLGSLYFENRQSTIYANAQNAHDDTINESVMNAIRNLLKGFKKKKKLRDLEEKKAKEVKEEKNADETNMINQTNQTVSVGFSTNVENKEFETSKTTGDIYNAILQKLENESDEKKTKVLTSFRFLMIHPAKYEDQTLANILLLVWDKIIEQTEDIRKQLEQRLIEELYEMDCTCGTGLCLRLVNILSGFISDEQFQIKINIKDQLRSNIFARLGKSLHSMSELDQEKILTEISSTVGPKDTAIQFVEFYGEDVKNELIGEFVNGKFVDRETFDSVWNRSIGDFIGKWVST